MLIKHQITTKCHARQYIFQEFLRKHDVMLIKCEMREKIKLETLQFSPSPNFC